MGRELAWEAYRAATFAVFLRAYSPTIDPTPIERLALELWARAVAANKTARS